MTEPTTNLQVYLPLDEMGGDTAYDYSGNEIDGTVTGATIVGGKHNNGRYFDGDDYINCGANPDITDEITVSLWAKSDFTELYTFYVGRIGRDGWWLQGRNDGVVNCRIRADDGSISDLGSGAGEILADTWHHIVLVFSGSQGIQKIYVDNVEVATRIPLVSDIGIDSVLRLGYNLWWGYYSKGIMDEVRIYDRVLNENERAVLFTQGSWRKWYEEPKQRVIVGENTIDTDSISTVVTLRESGFSDCMINANDELGKTFLSRVNVGDSITIEYKYEDGDDTYTTVFEGTVEELNPNLSIAGEIISIKGYDNGFALKKMRVAQEYGSESLNPTLDTLKEILTDATHGIIPKYINKILGGKAGNMNSGYNIQDTYIEDIDTIFKYILHPFAPTSAVLRDLCNLIAADKYPDAGVHWQTLKIADVDELCIATIGNHGAPLTTYWADKHPRKTLEIGLDILSSRITKIPIQANYILGIGIFQKPVNEVWTEQSAEDWWGEESFPPADDGVFYKIGDYSIKLLGDSAASTWTHWYYLGDGAMNLDIEKIGSKVNLPIVSFYAAAHQCAVCQLRLITGAPANNDFFYINFNKVIPSSNKFYYVEIPMGNLADNFEWGINGSPSWNDIDYIGFSVKTPLAPMAPILWIDDLHIGGVLVRAAYHSTNITANKCKIQLVTDCLAKSDNLIASDDSGTFAQLLKMELIRSMSTPTLVTVTTGLDETVMVGQIVNIFNSRNTNFGTNGLLQMRILELRHIFTVGNCSTILVLTDDLKNSYPIKPSDAYSDVLKATNPTLYQDRDRASLVGKDIDIYVPILEKDYA